MWLWCCALTVRHGSVANWQVRSYISPCMTKYISPCMTLMSRHERRQCLTWQLRDAETRAHEACNMRPHWHIAIQVDIKVSNRGCWSHLHRTNRKVSLCEYSFLVFLWSPYRIEQTIIFSSCGFFFLLLFFPRLISAVADWMSAILPHMVWP